MQTTRIDVTPQYLASQGLSQTLPFRFWSKVIIDEGCWDWDGYKDKDGYGTIRARASHEKLQAHQVAWLLYFGPIPSGLWVCHHCDNPPCTRPDHIFSGTAKQNSEDRDKKGRSGAIGERHWKHKLTEGDVLRIRELYFATGRTQISIAEDFEVSEGAIQCLLKRRTWKHI